MNTVTNTINAKLRDKGSKFIGYLFPATSVEEFEAKLEKLKSKYPDATHHCYGWRINPNNLEEFAQDDGEPSGTAGLPILNQLKSYNAINCGCVVVRYYGGTKLGKSGLIQAYGHTAALCLADATLLKIVPTTNFEITYSYDKQNQIEKLKNQFDLKELDAQYLETVTLKLACRAEQSEAFSSHLEKLEHQGVKFQALGSDFVTMKS